MSAARLDVVVAADAAYAPALAVVVRSLLDRTGAASVRVWALDGGLGSSHRRRLEGSWADGRVDLHWVDLEGRLPADVPLWGGMSRVTYSRLLLPDLLPPDCRTVLWLDCDMLVRADVADLSRSCGPEVGVFAVPDLAVPRLGSRYGVADPERLGLDPDAPYFNAGLMMIDLAWWREHEVTERALAYLRERSGRVWFWDQEALNVVLAHAWRPLPPRWNLPPMLPRPEGIGRAEWNRLRSDPALAHFSGTLKPWSYRLGSALQKEFFDTIDRTAYAGLRPPRTPRAALVGCYARALRPALHPLERLWMRARRLR